VWAYRRDFEPVQGLSVGLITAISMLGGAIGALLLVETPESTFVQLIPWLLLSATLVFAFGRTVADWLNERVHVGQRTILLLQFAIAIYGGYFGGGIGILMLAAFSIFGMTKLNAMNAVKTWLSACLNAIAVVLFIYKREIFWPEALIMAAASIFGGYGGAAVARRVEPAKLRAAIIAVGLALCVYFFLNPKV
jgi:uncharacterized membrane protein YfcA